MVAIKNKIKNRFSRAKDSYNSVSWVQKETSRALIEKLRECFPDFYPKTILDLGTGTGLIPYELLKYYNQSLYTLNDISCKILEGLFRDFGENPQFSFCIGDFETINFSEYELIISNLAFQWIDNLQVIIEKFFRKSNIFAFSCLLKDSFIEWNNLLASYGILGIVKKYPSRETICDMINSLGPKEFYVYTYDFVLDFSGAYECMLYLKNLGASAATRHLSVNTVRRIITAPKIDLKVSYKILFSLIKR